MTSAFAPPSMVRPGLCVFTPGLNGLPGGSSDAWATVWHIDAELAAVLLVCAAVLLWATRARGWRGLGYVFAAGGAVGVGLMAATLFTGNPFCAGPGGRLTPPEVATNSVFSVLFTLTTFLLFLAVVLLAVLLVTLVLAGFAQAVRRLRPTLR